MGSNWDDHIHTHGTLESVGPGLWQVTGSLPRSALPRNMHIWRAPSGGLLIHSAICLNDEGMLALDMLGPVNWIVVPCALHRADVLPYRERYPDAQILCPLAAETKVEEVVTVDAHCETVLPTLGIEVLEPKGLKPFELHLIIPLEDGTNALITTDSLFNLGPNPPSGFGGLILKWIGSVGPLGMTRLGRFLLLEDGDEWRTHLQNLSKIPNLSVLCMAHGDAIRSDVSAALEDAVSRLN